MTNPMTADAAQIAIDENTWPVKLEYDPAGNMVYGISANGNRFRVFDIRGWGFLTGGASLNLPHNEATKIQDQWARHMVSLWNTHQPAHDEPDAVKIEEPTVIRNMRKMSAAGMSDYKNILAHIDALTARLAAAPQRPDTAVAQGEDKFHPALFNSGMNELEFLTRDCHAVTHPIDKWWSVLKTGDGEVVGFKLTCPQAYAEKIALDQSAGGE